MHEEFIKEFSNLLEIPEKTLTSEFILNTVDTWDSIAHISTIALIDQHFNVVLSIDHLNKALKLKDLFLEIEKALKESRVS